MFLHEEGNKKSELTRIWHESARILIKELFISENKVPYLNFDEISLYI
jgi:hypothetical protein